MLAHENLQELRKAKETAIEIAQQEADNNEILHERLAALELALEDANWMKMTTEGDMEFSREGLRQIAELSRLMYLKNPLIQRSVSVQALYVWAQGVTVRAKPPAFNQVIQDFWKDPKNQAELTGHQARMYKEVDLQTAGNIFFVFFVRPTDGRVRVRSLQADEIEKIISDPEDAKTNWYYLRQWTTRKLNPSTGRMNTTRHKAYYPDWQYNPISKPSKFGNITIKWDQPVYHIRDGGFSDWKFGIGSVYTAIDWARAYKNFLEDVASLMRSYSRFAFQMKTQGGKRGVSSAKSKLNSTLGNSGTAGETNPSPVAGSTFIGAEGMDLKPMQLRGASISPEDGRRFLLMVAATFGLPETFYGDVSVGTLATGKTLDRPTELKMRNRQEMWTEVFRNILNYVVLNATKSTGGALKDFGTVTSEEVNGQIEHSIEWKKGIKPVLEIEFPPVLVKDVKEAVQAIVTAATLNGQQIAAFSAPIVERLLLTALAQDDVDEIMADLYPNEGDEDAASREPMPAEEAIKAIVEKLVEKFDAK